MSVAPLPDGAVPATGRRVRIEPGGKEFECGPQQSLLAAMENSVVGLRMLRCIPVGCRGGGCGVCRIRVTSGAYRAGKMSRAHLSEREQEQGYSLACRTFADSDLVIELAQRAE